MNRIEQKVRTARRRIVLGQFGRAFSMTLFVALIVATVAVALPALRVMQVDFGTWAAAWIGGCAVAAILAAAAYALFSAPSRRSVAVEVDRRFGLRERISSSMTLGEDDKDSDFGIALMSDAEKRADQLDVAERFSLKPNKLSWLPVSIVPVLTIVLLLVEPMTESSAKSTGPSALEAKQVKTVAAQLKKRIAQQRRKAESENLQEATDMYEKMEAQLDKIMGRQNMNKKDAMIAMNDLKKRLEERRDELGSSEQMRRAMSQMSGLNAGPGQKVAKSIAKGNFSEAEKIVESLASKMRSGELSEKEREELQKQIEQMKNALQKAVQQHEQRKQELQQQIEKARREGRTNDAAKLQQQLMQMQMNNAQMQKMGQMADAMAQAAQALKQGDASSAADALDQMSEQLGQMQLEMAELEDLESAMDQLSQSKSQMRCQNCGGAGCQACMGGFGGGFGQGFGLGRGNGEGDRPEQEGDTNTYESQVRGQVKKGRAIIAGFADGPNRKGITREDLKQAVEAAIAEESDPTENQTLPRTEREHAQQYFDKLRNET